MVFKLRKSWSMLIRKRKVMDVFTLQIQGKDIATIRKNPIKCWGKWNNKVGIILSVPGDRLMSC